MKISKELPTPRELKRLRQERDQSQDAAARSIGFCMQSWRNWESEKDKAEIPLCAWLVYQAGGIDAVASGEAFTPATPAKPTLADFKRFMKENGK